MSAFGAKRHDSPTMEEWVERLNENKKIRVSRFYLFDFMQFVFKEHPDMRLRITTSWPDYNDNTIFKIN